MPDKLYSLLHDLRLRQSGNRRTLTIGDIHCIYDVAVAVGLGASSFDKGGKRGIEWHTRNERWAIAYTQRADGKLNATLTVTPW